MAFTLGRFVRSAARRVASDPRTRETALKTGRGLAREARTIAGDEKPARAAGRSFRKALDRLQGNGENGTERQDGDSSTPEIDDRNR